MEADIDTLEDMGPILLALHIRNTLNEIAASNVELAPEVEAIDCGAKGAGILARPSRALCAGWAAATG